MGWKIGAAAVLLVGCGGPAPAAPLASRPPRPAPTASPPAPPPPEPEPAPAGAKLADEDARRLGQHLIETRAVVGAVLVVLDGAGTRFWSFGETVPGSGEAPRADSIFQIGSITKPFVAELVARRVHAGTLSLDDPLARLVPAPGFGATPTLLQVLTHRSAMPRMPPGAEFIGARETVDRYDVPELERYLAGYRPPSEPGSRYVYSNLAFGVLGVGLARRAGTDLEQLIVREICDPLGMGDTRFELGPDQRRRLVPGHSADRLAAPELDFGRALHAAGALRSTPRDLSKYLAAQLGRAPHHTTPAMKLARVPRAEVDFEDDIGLAWYVRRRGGIVWHNGATFGYRAFVAFDPAHGSAVAVLSNTHSPLVDEAGFAVLGRLAGEPLKLPRVREYLELDEQELQAYVGAYRASPTVTLDISREGDALYVDVKGSRRFRIYPQTRARFFLKVDDGNVRFVREHGRVRQLVYQNGGHMVIATKVR